MVLDELTDRIGVRTTRRTIVKTGAKIAYVAPVVAASFKLSALNVSAQAASPGGVAGTCLAGQDSCNGADFVCNGGGPTGRCFCTSTTEGGLLCGNFDRGSCSGYQSCTASTQCPAGEVCAPGPDCCGGICLTVCPAGATGVDTAVGEGPPYA